MMKLNAIAKKLTKEEDLKIQPRPYFNHAVEFKKKYTTQERIEALEDAGLNTFFFPSEMVTGCDMLSDSGTTTMTNEQWAALHLGDESYGSNRGYFELMKTIKSLFGSSFFNNPKEGKPNAFIFHQGRACENALFNSIGKLAPDQTIPSNGHFDTTGANIQANNIHPLNLFSPNLKNKRSKDLFKGDMDVKRLKKIIATDMVIPIIFLTITNNTGGGQPVSMKNIKEVSTIAHKNNIPLFLDACRFAENAWFIKQHEPGYKNKSISEITKMMFSYVDGFTISFKKDGLVNMGGGLFLKDKGLFIKKYPHIPDELINSQILKEGHPTYGGMSGRDIMTLVVGLKTVVNESYLSYRINQVQKLGALMKKGGLPVITPVGGHAVYLDMNEFFKDTKLKAGDFGGIAFTAILLGVYGHRACELGNFAFGTYNKKTKEETFPEVNYVRFAIPRLRYEDRDIESVAEAVKSIHDNRQAIHPIKVLSGKHLPLRHFKARFEFK